MAGAAALFWPKQQSSSQAQRQRPQAPVAVAPVVRKDMPVYLSGLGTVQAYRTVTVQSQVEGQLVEVRFREGQDVRAGDVLAKIDARSYQAQLDQALAAKARDAALLENAKRDLQRYAKLGDSVSAQTVDAQRARVSELEATLKADQAAIDHARTLLGYTTITAPISGRTGIRQIDQGNIIRPGDANGLVVITQVEPISVLFSLPQQHVQAINARLAALKGGKLPVQALQADGATVMDEGVLELVDNQIDQATGTIRLKATFPNAQRALWPGGFVNVRLLLDTREGALVIPTVAIQRGPQSGSYVFVYQPEGGTVTMRNVRTGFSEGQETLIEEGLAEHEPVVTDGMSKLQEGSKVRLLDSKEGPEARKPDARE